MQSPTPVSHRRPAPAPSGLADGPFVRLWAGTASSNLADGILLSAGPLLAATMTRDPHLVAGTVVANKLPWFLFSLLSGVVVDRVPHRTLLAAANLLRAVALLGLALALASDLAGIVVLYAALFVLGTAETVVDTAALAILPTVLEQERLEDGNGRIYATQSVLNELVGPPLGSALFALTSVLAFFAGSAAFALAGLVFLLLPNRAPSADSDRPPFSLRTVGTDIGEGLRWFAHDRLLRSAAMMAAVSNAFSSATLGVLILYAQDELGVGTAGYGWLLTGAAIGGALGGLVAPRLVRRLGSGPVIFLANALPAVTYVLLYLTSSYYVAWAALSFGAFAAVLGNVVVITLRQTAVPERLVGRVTSSYRLLALGAVPLGGLLGGVLAGAYGVRSPFLAGAVAMLVLAVGMAPIMTTRAIRAASEAGARA